VRVASRLAPAIVNNARIATTAVTPPSISSDLKLAIWP
jgi:hypothetical protein